MIGPQDRESARQCIARLEQLVNEVEQIIAFYRRKPLPDEQRTLVQSKLRDFKQSLEAESRRLKAAERDGILTAAETTEYVYAIREAWADIRSVRWSGRPDGKCYVHLVWVRETLKNPLSRLMKCVSGTLPQSAHL